MPARFGHFNANEYWSPEYGGIDWQLLVGRLATAGELEAYQPVGFDSGDDLVQEVTQENLVFRTSDVAPNMDMLAVADPRDGKDYIWFREDDPEVFEDLVRNIGEAALKMHSRYPLPDTVDIYLDRRSTGIEPEFLEQPSE